MVESVAERKRRNPRPVPEGKKPSSFGVLLRYIRTREEISQDEMGKAIGIDESTISRIEMGDRKPPRKIDFYRKLSDIPGITPADLLQLVRAHLYDIFGFNDDVIDEILSSAKIPDDLKMTRERSRIATEGGETVFLRLQTDAGVLTKKDVDLYGNIIEAETRLLLRALNERRLERSARLDQVFDAGEPQL